ncbi:MAG: SurA N-terminal domain-containing protein [Treponema sp.]|nr:SurA N-terminal domain-containing protein [Treponema sp.]
MKKIIAVLSILMLASFAVFAQSDLQVLAVVKLNKNESITLKQLRTRCEMYEKQIGRNLTVDEKKQVLDTLIEEKLIVQAAAKSGIVIPDSYVDQYFIQSMSQSLGASVTERELEDYFKKQGTSLEAILVEQTGMNKAEYKSHLKNQLLMNQYIAQKHQAEIQKVAATDEEIRLAYESNKSSFVWNDMAKMLLVIVPKGSDPDSAKLKATDYLNKYKSKALSAEQIAIQSQAEGSGFKAGLGVFTKTETAAAGLGLSLQKLVYVFNQKEGYISDVEETSNDYRFLSVIKKYDAKMLGISDLVQPETTVTVYEYIRSNLTQQKQQIYLNNAANSVAKELHTAENVDMKKNGAALDKLLEWGK